MSKNHKEVRKMPIYKKAMEIFELCDSLTSIVFEKRKDTTEYEMLEDTAKHIMENAMIIPAKIAGAEGGDLYDIRMENAAIIRKCAREIATNTYGFEMFDFKDIDYLELIREEIDEFRVLYAEWVKTFDQWNYIIDRWGLFNPPGVNYDDHDPDDDIPFNPDDFFDGIE